MARLTLAVSLLFAIALISGCAGNLQPTVHAQTGVPAGPTSATLQCDAVVPEIDNGHGVLKVDWPICQIASSTGNGDVELHAHGSYVTQFPINAKYAKAWVGSQTGFVGEWNYNLTITVPDGRQAHIVSQYDKHQDAQGNAWNTYDMPLNLPAGTQFDIDYSLRVAHVHDDCPNGCVTSAVWIFNSGIN